MHLERNMAQKKCQKPHEGFEPTTSEYLVPVNIKGGDKVDK